MPHSLVFPPFSRVHISGFVCIRFRTQRSHTRWNETIVAKKVYPGHLFEISLFLHLLLRFISFKSLFSSYRILGCGLIFLHFPLFPSFFFWTFLRSCGHRGPPQRSSPPRDPPVTPTPPVPQVSPIRVFFLGPPSIHFWSNEGLSTPPGNSLHSSGKPFDKKTVGGWSVFGTSPTYLVWPTAHDNK